LDNLFSQFASNYLDIFAALFLIVLLTLLAINNFRLMLYHCLPDIMTTLDKIASIMYNITCISIWLKWILNLQC